MSIRIVTFHETTYFHGIAAVRGRTNEYVCKSKLESCDIVWRKVDYITFSIYLNGVLEGISDI